MKKSQNPLRQYQSSFSCIEQKLKEYPIVGFDSEDNSKGTVTLFGFYNDDGGYVTKHHSLALDYIYNCKEPSIFVAHNLEYDFVNFFKHDNYEMVEDMTYTGSRLLQMTLKGLPHKFIDSGCFFHGTLKKMADFVGLEKLEGDSLSAEYVEMDARIVYEFMKQFQERLVQQEGVNLGVTIGQMAMDIYRRKYMLTKKQITYNSPNCLKAFYGGRVELFYLGTLDNGVSISDINSCYPDVMRNRDYPQSANMEPSTIDTHEFGIGHFEVYVPEDTFLPVLPFKDLESGRLFFPVGRFTGWWTYAEVRYAVENGAKIINEFAGEGTNTSCQPFKQYIDDFYNKRLEAKEKNDLFNDLLYKLWQNNLYGKWVQHHSGDKMTREKIPEFKLRKFIEHPDFDTKKVGPFYWYRLPKFEPPKTANFIWGVYVTSYARIKLHQGLMKVYKCGYTPVYCDTDSIMYADLKSKVIDKFPLPLSKKLGDWDVEKFDLGIFRQAKAYILFNENKETKEYIPVKVACKGVPTSYAYDFVIEAMATFQKPMRLKQGLQRQYAEVNKNKGDDFIHELGANIWNDVTKEMHSHYVKRKVIVGDTGVTMPQHVDDISDLIKNSYSKEPISYEKKVEHLNLKKPKPPLKFKHSPIPIDYFDDEPKRKTKMLNFTPSNNPYRIGFNELEGMKPGNWFSGYPVQFYYYKKGNKIIPSKFDLNSKTKYFADILVTKYKNETPPNNFHIEISAKIITHGFLTEKDLLKKYLEISLKKFNINKYPDLDIKLGNEIESTPVDLSIPDLELTKAQEKELLEYDFGAIKCQIS